VIDAAVQTAYSGKRQISCLEGLGDEACEQYGTYQYLPQHTLQAIKEYGTGLHFNDTGGGWILFLNVALRQINDSYTLVSAPATTTQERPRPTNILENWM